MLLIYASYSSGTATASERVEKILLAKGIQVTRKLVSLVGVQEVDQFDCVIFASPSWMVNSKEGQPHEFYQKFFNNAASLSLAGKKVAVLGLGDTSYMTFCGAVDVLEAFVKEHHGTLIVPSLKVDGFYYDQQTNMKLVEDWANTLAAQLAT